MDQNYSRVPTAEQRPTLNLWPETGRILGLSKSAVYDAAHTGEIPTIRVGRRILVPTAALRRMLALDVAAPQNASGGGRAA
jgi:excisionase family DNA binding protein